MTCQNKRIIGCQVKGIHVLFQWKIGTSVSKFKKGKSLYNNVCLFLFYLLLFYLLLLFYYYYFILFFKLLLLCFY